MNSHYNAARHNLPTSLHLDMLVANTTFNNRDNAVMTKYGTLDQEIERQLGRLTVG